MMKFGFFVSYPHWDPAESYQQIYRDAAEQIELADTAFDYIWFPEHHFVQTLNSPAPLLSVIDAAHRTKRARLGAAVILSAYYHPLIMAESLGLVDQLTGGRLEVAFGRGTYHYEYSRLNMTEAEASARQREAIEVLLGVWGEDREFEYHGKYYDFPPTYPVPRPIRPGGPQIGIAGRTTETIKFAVQNGLDLHTTPLRGPLSRVKANLQLLDAVVADLGKTRRPRVSTQRETVVTFDRAQALKAMEYVRMSHVAAWHFHQGDVRVHKGHPQIDPLPEGLDVTPEHLASRSMVGDPDACVQYLLDYEKLGFDEFITLMDFGQPQKEVMSSLRLFVGEVIPKFQAAARKLPSFTPNLDQFIAKRGNRPPAAQIKSAMIQQKEKSIGADWRNWESGDWIAHFDQVRRDDEGRKFYLFDYDAGPFVRGDASGFVRGGDLMLLRDEECPECGRPLIALYRRWAPDTMAQMKENVGQALRRENWHALHP